MVDHLANVKQQMAAAVLNKTKTKYQLPVNQRMTDSVELSSEVMKVRGDLSAARMKKISEIRSQLHAGTYLTPEKLDRALDRALDDALVNT